MIICAPIFPCPWLYRGGSTDGPRLRHARLCVCACAVQFQRESVIARQFVDAYYAVFDTNRQGILTFFRDASTISFEGSTFRGGANFLSRLQQMGIPLPCSHRIVTVNAQPSQVRHCVLAAVLMSLISLASASAGLGGEN